MGAELVVLRILHICGGIVWAGWIFSMALFVNPAVQAMGQAGGGFMQALASRTKLVTVMTATSIIVILAGLRLFWIVSGNLDAAWLSSNHGIALTIGGLLGICAFVYGLIFVRPKAHRMAVLGAALAASGVSPTPEQQAEIGSIKSAMNIGGKVVAYLLAACVLLMAIARNI